MDTKDRTPKSVSDALDNVADLYAKNLSELGAGPKSVGWKTDEEQRLRFDRLARVIGKADGERGIEVNDYGCGYGAMFAYLDGLPNVRLSAYNGYDISEIMLAEAERAIPDSRAAFHRTGDLTTEADYSFVSGTFNVRFEADDAAWKCFIEDRLRDLSRFSRRGFAFNLLSTYVDWKAENLYYGDPHYFFRFCKENLSPYVSLLHDYPLYEWTLLVRSKNYYK